MMGGRDRPRNRETKRPSLITPRCSCRRGEACCEAFPVSLAASVGGFIDECKARFTIKKCYILAGAGGREAF